MRKTGDKWVAVAAGPTTSSRMNSLEPQFIEKFRPGAIIGKGGMSQPTVDAMKKYGCVYLAITGGAAVLAAQGIKSVSGVEWFELGMPEAIWILNAENFGPLTVAIDAHGNSLYADVNLKIKENEKKARAKLGLT
jgi:fumarate hydratase subunit beta